MIGAKPLRITFDKVDRFIRVYDGTRYLVLFGREKYEFIYNSRYLRYIGAKISITYAIGVSDGIDVNKTSSSKECNICHFWYFLGEGFKFQPDACNGFHDVLMMSMKLRDIAILHIRRANYRCIISKISKGDA